MSTLYNIERCVFCSVHINILLPFSVVFHFLSFKPFAVIYITFIKLMYGISVSDISFMIVYFWDFKKMLPSACKFCVCFLNTLLLN